LDNTETSALIKQLEVCKLKKWSKLLIWILVLVLLLSACSTGDRKEDNGNPAKEASTTANSSADTAEKEKSEDGQSESGEETEDGQMLPVSAKDTLVVAHEADSIDLDPFGSTTDVTLKIKSQVYEPLVEMTIDNEILPALATEWEYIDDNGTLQMKLREGVKFHNGEIMTAQDVLFSLELASGSGQSMPVANIDFEKSSAPDDLTVILAQKTVRFDLVEYLSIPMAVIFSKKGYEDNGGNWATMDIGTGPYVWGEWAPGDHQDLHAFEDYWEEGYPLIQNITFKVITEATNRSIEIETGSCDLSYNPNVVDLPNLKSNENLYVYEELAFDNSIFGFNNADETWANSDLHKAFKWALDVDAAWELALNDTGAPAHTFVPSNVIGFLGEDRGYTTVGYDLDKAREFLEASGNGDGITCEFLVHNRPARLDIATFWANSLKQIGIDLQINILDSATITQRLKVEGTFDAFMWGIATYTSKADYLLRHMDGIDTPPTLAICRWQNQEYTDLLNKGVAEPDAAKAMEYTDAAQELLYENYPVIPLYQQQSTYVMVENLKGIRDGTYQVPLLKKAYFES
jgi:peptide/nickel transport system substrate-binding protein